MDSESSHHDRYLQHQLASPLFRFRYWRARRQLRREMEAWATRPEPAPLSTSCGECGLYGYCDTHEQGG